MNRWDIINALIDKFGYQSYLEIGCGAFHTFNRVKAPHKVSVDKYGRKGKPAPTYKMSSDAFFAQSKDKYDIIFIDGLHQCEQTLKDLINSIASLNDGGAIAMHDCNPPDEFIAAHDPHGGSWCGTTWKAVVLGRLMFPDWSFITINTDWGCCVVSQRFPIRSLLLSCWPLAYELLNANREVLLNLVDSLPF